MRYLYGDLSDFPLQSNTLERLRRFVDMAVDLLRSDNEVERLLAGMDAERAMEQETLSHIAAYEQALLEAIPKAVEAAGPDRVVSVLAEGTGAQISAFIDEGRRRMQDQVEAGIARSHKEIEAHRREMDEKLRGFFVDSGIPVTNHRIGFALDPETRSYQAWAQVEDVVGLQTRHRLKPSDCEFFSQARKGFDLFPERLELPVGVRKAWLKKDPVTDSLRLDEASLAGGEDGDRHTDLVFTPKGAQGSEQVKLRVPKKGDRAVQVWRSDAEGQVMPVDPEFVDTLVSEQIRQVSRAVAPHLLELFRARAGIQRIHLDEDEQDVVRARRVPDLIDRVVRHLAPTIIEIHKRSPAPAELCLKVEHESGRREEIYIRRSDLLSRIKELPAAQRKLFGPLQLDFVHRAGEAPHQEKWDEITGKRKDPTGGVQRRDDTDVTRPDPAKK